MTDIYINQSLGMTDIIRNIINIKDFIVAENKKILNAIQMTASLI